MWAIPTPSMMKDATILKAVSIGHLRRWHPRDGRQPPLRERAVALHLIHGAPQRVPFSMDRQEALVQVPCSSRLRAAAPLSGVVLSTLATPLADRFMRHGDTAFAQGVFSIAIAQGEARGELDAVTDHFTGKAGMLLAFDGGRSRYDWLPILGCV